MADKVISNFNFYLSTILNTKVTVTVFFVIWSAAVDWYYDRLTDDQFHQLVGASLEQMKFLLKKH